MTSPPHAESSETTDLARILPIDGVLFANSGQPPDADRHAVDALFGSAFYVGEMRDHGLDD